MPTIAEQFAAFVNDVDGRLKKLEAAPPQPRPPKVVFGITGPNPDWTEVSLDGHWEFVDGPHAYHPSLDVRMDHNPTDDPSRKLWRFRFFGNTGEVRPPPELPKVIWWGTTAG